MIKTTVSRLRALVKPQDGETAMPAVPTGDVDTTTALARKEQAGHNWQAARDLWQQVIERTPADTGAWVQLGNMHNELADYAAAIEAFAQAGRLDPALIDAPAGIAGVHERQGNWTGACQCWQQVLAMLPAAGSLDKRLHAVAHAALAAQASGQDSLVAELMIQAVALDQGFLDRPEALRLRAKSLQRDQPIQAKRLLAACIAARPGDAGARFEYATVSLEDGAYDDGLAMLAPALRDRGADRSFLWLAADLHERLREWSKAFVLAERISAMDPIDIAVLRRCFRLAVNAGDLAAARAYACAFSRAAGGELELINLLREAYEAVGEFRHARLICRLLVRSWPHSLWHRNHLAKLTAATLGLVAADRLLRARIGTTAGDNDFDQTYCEVAFRASEHKEAERRLSWFLEPARGQAGNLGMQVLLGYVVANATGLAEAESHFAAVATRSYQSKPALVGLAHMAWRRRDSRTAFELWGKVAAMFPEDSIAQVEHARSAYNYGRAEEAARISGRRMAAQPDDVTVGEFHAWLLVATGAYEAAWDFVAALRAHSGPNWSLMQSAVQSSGALGRLDTNWPVIMAFMPRVASDAASKLLYPVIRLLQVLERPDLASAVVTHDGVDPRRLVWLPPYIGTGMSVPAKTESLARTGWLDVRSCVRVDAADKIKVATDGEIAALLDRPKHRHPTVHIVNKFEQARGGSELHALDVASRVAAFATVELWAPEMPHPHFSRFHNVKGIDCSQGKSPYGGTIVFIGVYFDVQWIAHVRPDRVIFLYNTFEAPTLFDRVRQVHALTGVHVELLFCSNLMGTECGLPGLFEPSPIDIEQFSPAPARQPRPFTLGRHSRDVVEKHHPEDWQVYDTVEANGGRSVALGGTCMAQAFPPGASVELLPARSDRIPEFLHGLDAYFYRTSTWVEPWGRVVIEAMACGLPVLAHDVGGYAQAIQHESNGLLFHTTAEANRLVRRLMDEPDLRRSLGAAARETVETMLSPVAMRRLASFYLLQ